MISYSLAVSPDQICGFEQKTSTRDLTWETGRRIQGWGKWTAENEEGIHAKETGQTEESKWKHGEKKTIQGDALLRPRRWEMLRFIQEDEKCWGAHDFIPFLLLITHNGQNHFNSVICKTGALLWFGDQDTVVDCYIN